MRLKSVDLPTFGRPTIASNGMAFMARKLDLSTANFVVELRKAFFALKNTPTSIIGM